MGTDIKLKKVWKNINKSDTMVKNGKGGILLPRQARKFSSSNIYHIIIRGIDKQDIFYNDNDKNFFLSQLLEIKKKFNVEIYAYCLMYNHVHLILKVQKELMSKSIQSLGIRYSQYFNKKYDRTGAFFENRFKSKNVENKQYFMDVCRYVHRNPEKAGFSVTENYKWSSYNEYLGKEKIINKSILLHYYENNIEKFIDYTINQKRELLQETREMLEYEFMENITDEDLSNIIMKKEKIESLLDVTKFNMEKKEKFVKNLKEIPGTNVTQIARVTRLSRYFIDRIWKKFKKY
ncbi:MAG: transposase [Clostridia bacterium]|nr:transposase [Clostridia bacterium]